MSRITLSLKEEVTFLLFLLFSEEHTGSDAIEIKLAVAKGKVGIARVFSKVVGFKQSDLEKGVADACDRTGGFQVRECLAFQI